MIEHAREKCHDIKKKDTDCGLTEYRFFDTCHSHSS